MPQLILNNNADQSVIVDKVLGVSNGINYNGCKCFNTDGAGSYGKHLFT